MVCSTLKSGQAAGSRLVAGPLVFQGINFIPRDKMYDTPAAVLVKMTVGPTDCILRLAPECLESYGAFRKGCLRQGVFVECPAVEDERHAMMARRAWNYLVIEASELGGASK